ncbi:MAG: hypothetical protein MUC53_06410 [Candidatus Contendobacter sp.]|nr:hypothetical protein [Candidatus Contendobacter sp.]
MGQKHETQPARQFGPALRMGRQFGFSRLGWLFPVEALAGREIFRIRFPGTVLSAFGRAKVVVAVGVGDDQAGPVAKAGQRRQPRAQTLTVHELEPGLWQSLLRLRHELQAAYFILASDGDCDEALKLANRRVVKQAPDPNQLAA